MKAVPVILQPPQSECRAMMGVLQTNQRALKIVFILGLLVTYLVFMFQPSLARFLSFSVTVEVNTVSQANIQKCTRQCA